MKQHSDEVRAAVVAALLAGQSISQVAKEYNLPVGTIKAWKSRGVATDIVKDATRKNSPEVGDLLIGYLRENLETLRQQVVIFRDKSWLTRQNAADVAVLHGVLTDKSMRLLDAMAKVNDVSEAELPDS